MARDVKLLFVRRFLLVVSISPNFNRLKFYVIETQVFVQFQNIFFALMHMCVCIQGVTKYYRNIFEVWRLNIVDQAINKLSREQERIN